MALTVAVNAAVVAPAATVTLGGTAALALLLESVTAKPPPGAAPLSVTVHAEVPGAFTLDGVHDKALGVTKAVRLIVVLTDWVFKVAVTVALALVAIVPAVALNVPLLEPVPIVMLAGTVSSPVLLAKLTEALLSAALFSVTVQVDACPVPSVEGEQLTEDNCAGAVSPRANVFEVPLAVAVKVAV